MDNRSVQPAFLDQLAVALSGLCLVHCLLFPVAIIVLPFLGQFADDHLHAEMLVFVIPVSLLALWFGYRRHRQIVVWYYGIAGLLLLTIGGTLVHDNYGLLADRAMTVAGSIVLAITHYRNFRLSRSAALANQS